MQELGGKVAVITGAGSGIGEGIARAAAQAAMKVVVADIDVAKGQAVVGLSESLLMEVAEHGVGVSLLCPGLTDTNLMSQSLAVRPDTLNPGIAHQQEDPDTAAGISPDAVGGQVIDAVRDGSFYVITHDDYRDIIEMRHKGIIDALDAQTARYGSTSGKTATI